jgi:Cu+-exporting ATPase
MDVAPGAGTPQADYAGRKYFFCSEACRKKFAADPARTLHAPDIPAQPAAEPGSQWTCPMHPQIVRDGPGFCPICGMALEPMLPSGEANPELKDMTRRFWVGLALALPVVALEMGRHMLMLDRAIGARIIFSCCSRRPSCCGQAGRSSCAPGPRCAAAT